MASKTHYAIDIVDTLVSEIGVAKPTYYQRDGRLFITSGKVAGIVYMGLNPTHQAVGDFATNIASADGETGEKQKIKFAKGEDKRINPIRFMHDDSAFSLDDLVKTGTALSKLPDDGKIRLIQHDGRYHSHKYGYASDGEDVWLSSACVMDREKYFELFRDAESKLKAINCAVLTPHVAVSFPTEVILEDSWRPNTSPAIRGFTDASILSEQPFGVYLHAHPIYLNLCDKENEPEMQTFDKLKETVQTVLSKRHILGAYVNDLNELCGEEARQKAEARREMMERAREAD